MPPCQGLGWEGSQKTQAIASARLFHSVLPLLTHRPDPMSCVVSDLHIQEAQAVG